jgi:2-dehydro-3-deoxyphosphogluconate aldolase/(4S)-4-hydroxy-2-oxoglutarate aldolase
VTALDTVVKSRLLAIVRSTSAAHAETIVTTLVESGVAAIEISLTTPGAVDIIRSFHAAGKSPALLGAGTVLTAEQTRSVVDAGGSFIVTPGVAESVDEARRLGIESFVGVMTPTEAIDAMRRGAAAVKLFPAEIGGPAFLKAMLAPLPDYRFIPVGGVTVELVAKYLDAGASALGVGSPLTGAADSTPDIEAIRERVIAYRQAIDAWTTGAGIAR